MRHRISLHLTWQGMHLSNTDATTYTQSLQSHMTATAAHDIAYTPDVAYTANIARTFKACRCTGPPKHAFMTEHAETSNVDHKVSAPTPVPFKTMPVNRSSTPRAAPFPQNSPPPVMATVRVPGDKLAITDLAALQKLPAFEVPFQVPMATLMGALKRLISCLKKVATQTSQ